MDWQPIETAPDGKLLIVGDFKEADTKEHYVGVAQRNNGRWGDGYVPDWVWNGAFRPTHWMPLPPPPAA